MATVNVTGFNKNGVTAMKDAIATYKNSLKKATNINVTNTEIQKAIKGTNVEAQVDTLAKTINTEVTALFNQLDAFSNKIDEVASAYESNDSTATAISDVTKSIKS